MRVDFFRFEGGDGAVVSAAVQAVFALPADDSRTKKLPDSPYRAQSLSRSGRLWEGDMVRIRMDDIPIICSLAGAMDEVDLNEDQGIGEETAFLYDTKTQVLAIQANRIGMSASKWARYFELFREEEGDPIIPVVVPEMDAAGAINRLEAVRKVHIRYAGMVNANVLVAPGMSTTQQIKAVAKTAPIFEMTMSMGRRPGTLSIAASKELLKQTLEMAKDALVGDGTRVDRIDVKGTFDDDTVAEMNLLEFLMRETIDVPINNASRRMLYADRRSGIATAFANRQADLDAMYKRARGN